MKKTILALTSAILLSSSGAFAAEPSVKEQFVKNYANIVLTNYTDAQKGALAMQQKINAFHENPTEANLKAAKTAWIEARVPYEQSETYRFYEGPIDFADKKSGKEGPEGRLNSWPLDEAYIDYVQDNSKAGIVNSKKEKITRANLINKNQQENEANVSLGYHAVEFLLWGQDLSTDSAGKRPASDFAATKENQKRREYLKVATEILVDDLNFLVNEWQDGKKNYAQKFVAQNPDKSIGHILTGLATLSGFELASERMGAGLDSGDQEDEQSCFSDNTHADFVNNFLGIKNVFLGTYGKIQGVGAYDVIASKDKTLAKKIKNKIADTLSSIKKINDPIDQVLTSPKGSSERAQMEKAVKNLQELAELLKEAGKVLGVEVTVVSE